MSGSKDAAYVSDTSTRVYVVGFGTMTYGDAMLLVQQGTIPAPSTDGSQLEPNTPLPRGFIVITAGVTQVGSAEPRSDSDNIAQWDGDADNEESDGDADNEKSDEDEDPPSDRGISTCLTREESAVARAVDDAGCGYPFLKRFPCDGTCGGLHCKGNAAALHYVETEYFAEMSELRRKAPAFRDDEHDQEDKREISRRLKLHLEELRKSHGKQWLDHVESIHRAMKSDRASAWEKRSCQGGVSSSV